MVLTPQDVSHIATLSRLALTPSEAEQYAKELTVIFGFVEQLNEVDTSGVEETCQVTGLMHVLREDNPLASSDITKDAIRGSFPASRAGLLLVPGVFE